VNFNCKVTDVTPPKKMSYLLLAYPLFT